MTTTNLTVASPCPTCGGALRCFTRDVGGVNYEDAYYLTCERCGLLDQDSVYGGNPVAADWHTNCPFCDQPETAHHEVPAKFLTPSGSADPSTIQELDMTTINLTAASLCLTCGGALKCFVFDEGPPAAEYFKYSLICVKCGVQGRDAKYGGQVDCTYAPPLDTNCPYCGQDLVSHKTTPERFQ